MIELGSDREGDRDQQSYVPSTSDSDLNLQVILSQQIQSQKQVQEIKADVLDQNHEVKKQFLQQMHNIHNAVTRIAIKLYKNPRTLFNLWQKYKFGISGTSLLKNSQELSMVKTRVCIAIEMFLATNGTNDTCRSH